MFGEFVTHVANGLDANGNADLCRSAVLCSAPVTSSIYPDPQLVLSSSTGQDGSSVKHFCTASPVRLGLASCFGAQIYLDQRSCINDERHTMTHDNASAYDERQPLLSNDDKKLDETTIAHEGRVLLQYTIPVSDHAMIPGRLRGFHRSYLPITPPYSATFLH